MVSIPENERGRCRSLCHKYILYLYLYLYFWPVQAQYASPGALKYEAWRTEHTTRTGPVRKEPLWLRKGTASAKRSHRAGGRAPAVTVADSERKYALNLIYTKYAFANASGHATGPGVIWHSGKNVMEFLKEHLPYVRIRALK